MLENKKCSLDNEIYSMNPHFKLIEKKFLIIDYCIHTVCCIHSSQCIPFIADLPPFVLCYLSIITLIQYVLIHLFPAIPQCTEIM